MKRESKLSSKAAALQKQGKLEEAGKLYAKVLAASPNDLVSLYSFAIVLVTKGEYKKALTLIDRFIGINKEYANAWHLRASILAALGSDEEALKSYERALQINPNHIEVLCELGVFYCNKNKTAEGLVCWDRLLRIKPDHCGALNNYGNVLYQMHKLDLAINTFERLLQINPGYDFAWGLLGFARLRCCDWRDYELIAGRIREAVGLGKRACKPLAFQAFSQSDTDSHICAKTFAGYYCQGTPKALWQGEKYNHNRIKLAYVSADLREHPVGHLMVGVIEQHDKTKFETIAISLSGEDSSDIRKRLLRSFDQFIDVTGANALNIAKKIRELEIDIAVDLGGYTTGAMPEIFSYRPAPVQVNYLGYPGTMGAEFMDYILADRVVIPEAFQHCYTEQVVYLPDTYLPTNSGMKVSERKPAREEAGLPSVGFVFCSFSHDYKINPPVFDVWMRILAKVEGSVIWLMSRDKMAQDNLKREASSRGINPERLVFATRVPLIEDHLARYALADLFLDTFPYNAHTTAADALFVGLPVLTCQGKTFPGRVAGSLLKAIGMDELIASSPEDYEKMAINLAEDNLRLNGLKNKLALNKNTHALFDTTRFCRNLESAYCAMMHNAVN